MDKFNLNFRDVEIAWHLSFVVLDTNVVHGGGGGGGLVVILVRFSFISKNK
jgi:hypothetical protein